MIKPTKHLTIALFSIVLVAVLGLSTISPASVSTAPNQAGDALAPMEQTLFDRTYANESPEDRLSRMEKVVFGSAQANQPVATRTQRLSQFLTNPHAEPKTPIQPTTPPPPPPIVEYRPIPPAVNQPASPLPGETAYPTITAMERRVFQQTFERDPVEYRLNRLEQRVLGHPQQGSLQERSDQLAMMVLGDVGASPTPSTPSANNSYGPGAGSANASSQQTASADMMRALPVIEKKVLRQAYPQDTVENRVNRLEQKLFNSTAPEMSLDDRFFRIAGVVNAQRSSRQEQAYYGGPVYSGGGVYQGGVYRSGRVRNSPGYGSMASMLLMILMSVIP